MKKIKVKWGNVLTTQPLRRYINLTNVTRFRIVFFKREMVQEFFVGIERKGCYSFPIEKFYHTDYVAEKLNLYTLDAAVIADWMNAQLGNNVEQQGTYCDEYFEDSGSLNPERIEHE